MINGIRFQLCLWCDGTVVIVIDAVIVAVAVDVQFYDEATEVRRWITSQSQLLSDYERRTDISLEDGEKILRELQACFVTSYKSTCVDS